MGSVDRADYMDNIRVAEIEQTIQREKRIQRQFFTKQEQEGKIALRPPTPPRPAKTLVQTHGLPGHLDTLRTDPESAMHLQISRQMWGSCNPGYVVRDGAAMTSTAKSDYIWDEEEIDFMKQQRMLDKTHNRRRDEHTKYVEARAFYDSMMKGT